MEYIEVSAKTIDDALTEASIKLGTTSDKLEYEVIDKGSNGFLGIGSRDAVIKVKKAEASVEDEIREFLDSVFKAMKLEVTIDIKVDEDNRNVDVELNGPEMGVLIGKRGQTLDSLQYLTNLAIMVLCMPVLGWVATPMGRPCLWCLPLQLPVTVIFVGGCFT